MTATRRARDDTSATESFVHVAIENVSPAVDAGRYASKRVLGEVLVVGADIMKDGHDLLAARVRFRGPGDEEWRYHPLYFDQDSDRWFGGFPLDRLGRWVFTVEAWTDHFATWRSKIEKKLNAGQDVSVDLLEGGQLVEAAAKRSRPGEGRTALATRAALLGDERFPMEDRARAALDLDLPKLMEVHDTPRDLTVYAHELPVVVDRPRAAFASWYEMFPRSQTDDASRPGTFVTAAEALPRLARLGFDVVYLPPIHPIGRTFRKGKNNSLVAEPEDVGSPWAIGNENGGHDAIDPSLGTVEDFERFVERANELGMEVALDFALQCSPDHPWVKEHPEWFHIRPDGTIAYAENPPKKYQDIYPINFWSEDREGLWNACRDVLLYWVDRGVETFRVDNPHTKPFAFWEWVIAEVQREHPDVVFFSEAFTRPKRLLLLAKLGFTQSYTYFTWKNTSWEIREWMKEFSTPEVLNYYRGNLFANTPDILHEYLQRGGRPAFRVRLLLAGTLSPLYGIYSGYELCENVPVRPGSEEYLDSEKYEVRPRDYEVPGNINADIALLNRIRRENPALQRADNLSFHKSENEQILFFKKSMPDGSNDLLIAANLDPFRPQATMVHVPVQELGIGADELYMVEDLLTGVRYQWRGARNFVLLDPALQPGHVLRVERLARQAARRGGGARG